MPKRRCDNIAPNRHERTTTLSAGQNAQKRRRTIITVEEVQQLLSYYDGASSFDDIPDNPILRRLFGNLRSRFRPETTQSERNVAKLRKTDISAIKLPESVSENWSTWREDRWSFWGAHTFQRDRFDHQGPVRNVKTFVESSWDLDNKTTSLQILWRFNCVALFLTFCRWKPEWQPSSKIKAALIRDFLSGFGCELSDSNIQKTLSIVRSGQRRLAFCKELSGSNELLNWKMKGLGILFLDCIPDSSFDDARGLRKEDISRSAQFLRSNGIAKWLETSDVGEMAIFLMELPVCHIWLEHQSDKATLDGITRPSLQGMNSLVAAAAIAGCGGNTLQHHGHLTSTGFTSNCPVQAFPLAGPADTLPAATMSMVPNTERNINDFDENWQVPETTMRMDELWGQDDDWALLFRPNLFS
ncbi:hypothetical protein V2A60_008784 [Cordyceps javanica]